MIKPSSPNGCIGLGQVAPSLLKERVLGAHKKLTAT